MDKHTPKVWDDELERWITLPSHKEVCPRCHGEGKHVNPAIDGNGISTDDECWDDDYFREMYFGGGYDVTCKECGGRNVIDVVDDVDEDHPLYKYIMQWCTDIDDREYERQIRRMEQGYLDL